MSISCLVIIGVFRVILPLCIAHLLYIIIFYTPTRIKNPHSLTDLDIIFGITSSYSLVEIGFYLYYRKLLKKIKNCKRKRIVSRNLRTVYFDKILKTVPDITSGLCQWFLKEDKTIQGPGGFISKIDVLEWLASYFFYVPIDQLSMNEIAELNKMIEKLDLRLKDERIEANCMKLLLDPININHRPFIVYFSVAVLQLICNFILTLMGFKNHEVSGFTSYWVRKGNDLDKNQKDKTPIFFIHGMGVGLIMYLHFILKIVLSKKGRSIFLIQLPFISMQYHKKVPNLEECILAMDRIFTRHGLADATFVSHSYGSIINSWLIRNRPSYVSKSIMIDPICFMLWAPDTLYNFLYRPVKKGERMQKLCEYFVSTEMFIVNTLTRNFWWHENVLFVEDLTTPLTVHLSENDFIVNCNRTSDYLRKNIIDNDLQNISLHVHEKMFHGQFLFEKSLQKTICSQM